MIEKVLERLEKVRKTGHDKWIACCPAHPDKSPSMSVGIGRDGRVLVHCFAGCRPHDIVEAIGLRIGDLFSQPTSRSKSDLARGIDHKLEETVLWLCREQRAMGVKLSTVDLERERLAWIRLNQKESR